VRGRGLQSQVNDRDLPPANEGGRESPRQPSRTSFISVPHNKLELSLANKKDKHVIERSSTRSQRGPGRSAGAIARET
jgi:hypothetical protein